MHLVETGFTGLFIIAVPDNTDNRGNFKKFFNSDFFALHHLETDYREFYFSCSKKNVIRGMHFQSPPHDHAKIIAVGAGGIKDIVLDIRKDSPTFGKHFCCELTASTGKALYVPRGFAHGFLALEDNTIVNYLQTSCYNKEHDKGILYNSFDADWNISNPIISERDLSFDNFKNFNTPF